MTDKPKVKIKLKEFVADLKSGFDDRALIEKYNLSQEMLPKVFEKLVSGGHISQKDLWSRNILDSTQKVASLFSFPFDSGDK